MSILSDIGTGIANTALGLVENAVSIGSEWGGLNPDLIAVITPCDDQGVPIGIGVKAPFVDGNLEQDFSWQSPFENLSPESKHPTLMASLQSGGLGQAMQSISLLVKGDSAGGEDSALGGLGGEANDLLMSISDKSKGRTGITKMNSRQIFAGHGPMKITGKLIFRAYLDPQSEVANPFWRLVMMALPQKMAKNYIEAVPSQLGGNVDEKTTKAIETFLPSLAPKFVKFTFKGETYGPLVIESIGKPMDAPYSVLGDVCLEVPINMGSLHSLDADDASRINARSNGLSGAVSDAIAKIPSLF